MDWDFVLVQLLNAVQYSMLLFLLSIGLTVIFGLLHFVNLAHGALYMAGAYLGISLAKATGNFWLALLLAPVAVSLIGMLLYVVLIRRFRHASAMNQVLVTFGLVFVGTDLVRIIWGDIALGLDVPEALAGTLTLAGVPYPSYRLGIILLGLLVLAALWLTLARTRVGAMIRAAVENSDMAAALGIDVQKLFFAVFCVGTALAGLAGVVAAPLFSATVAMSIDLLVPALMVVVIGGLGSLEGALAGSLVVGFVETMGAALLPDVAAIVHYLLLALVLLFRPQGLIPARGLPH